MYDGKEFKQYTMENGLSSDESYTIYVDDFDKVFVGTWHGGVNYFDGKLWNSLDSRDGLLNNTIKTLYGCLLYTSPSPRDRQKSRMPSSA